MMPAYGGSGPFQVPREATAEDLREVVDGFAAAARNAAAAGFDGVEVHAANGYLLDQFITEYTNLRTDEYGGSTANRVRFVAEIVAAARRRSAGRASRSECASPRPRSTTWSTAGRGGGDDVVVIAQALAKAGASYLHVASEGRAWFDTALLADGSTVTGLAGEVSGLPVIANGGMHDPEQAGRVLDDGHADFLSIGHAALANPDLPQRLAAGTELADVRPGHAASGCHTGHQQQVATGGMIVSRGAARGAPGRPSLRP